MWHLWSPEYNQFLRAVAQDGYSMAPGAHANWDAHDDLLRRLEAAVDGEDPPEAKTLRARVHARTCACS